MIDPVHRAVERLDELRIALRWADDPAKRVMLPEKKAAEEVLAASFVGVCATTEQFFREMVAYVVGEIDSRALSAKNLRPSLHSLASTAEFRSLQTLRKSDKVFEHRIRLLDRVVSQANHPMGYDPTELGTSGVTVRPTHVALFWTIAGLPGSPFGNLHQSVSLTVLADNRNDYAHGNVSMSQFLQSPECESTQILDRIDAVEDWFFHCWSAVTAYFTSRMYRR